MNLQRLSKITAPLKTLGIVFLMLFALAFACDDDSKPSPRNNNSEIFTESTPARTNNGGSCSTEAEFEEIIKRDILSDKAKRMPTSNFEMEVIFNAFEVDSPINYSPVYNNKVVKIYPAYPVTVNRTERVIAFGKITESDYEGALYYCYKNPEDYSKYPQHDPRFPKNACVCIAQPSTGITPNYPVRECPYEEGQSDKTCPAN